MPWQHVAMMKPVRITVLVVTCVFLCTTGSSFSADSRDLVKLREVYEDALRKAEETFIADLAAAPEKHIQDMVNLEAQIQKAGELKPLLAVREERQRFSANPEIPTMPIVESPKQLSTLQETCQARYKEIGLNHAQATLDLSGNYVRRLTALQKDLTQKGRINEALEVMKEIETVKESGAVVAALKHISSGGTGVLMPTQRPRTDTISIKDLIHGEVVSWNSISGEATCKYDFSSKEQFGDWEDSEVDELRERLVCDSRVVTFQPTFKSISRVEYQAYLYSGENGMRLALGDALTAEIGAGPEHSKLLLYQDNEHFPLVSFERDIEAYMKYEVVLTIADDQVQWDLNGKNIARIPLQRPLASPLRVSFGREGNRTMYDDLTITGVLSGQ